MQVTLVSVFLVVGYSLTLMGLSGYRATLRALQRQGLAEHRATSLRSLTVGLVVLEIAIVVVVVLFLLESF